MTSTRSLRIAMIHCVGQEGQNVLLPTINKGIYASLEPNKKIKYIGLSQPDTKNAINIDSVIDVVGQPIDNLPQTGDNLTIMDNPIGLLLKAVGKNPLEEGCFEVMEDAVQCYTPRFKEGENLAAFRSPHNSPNNIIHLHNVYPERLIKYFPKVGKNVIVLNAIKTDTQFRLSGHDCDSDFVYVTNQEDLAMLARKAYIEYPTIINLVEEKGNSDYHFTLEDCARMDNQIADNQEAIGTSTDVAQLALSYYYDEVIIDAAQKYNESNKRLEFEKDKYPKDTFFELKNRNMTRFLNKAKKQLEPGTILQLVDFALYDENKNIRNTVLKYLFENCKTDFMNCFVKSDKKMQ